MSPRIGIVGGGLAGSEAAWQIAESGVPVILHEMRGVRGTDAHKTDGLAELVCSNSFRSDDDERNAVGLLHWEMGAADGIIMQTARAHRLPAGGALADGVNDQADADPRLRPIDPKLLVGVSRNAPCPCGSGRKFKHCHGSF